MKVLVVDDDVVSRQKLQWFVKSFGYETIEAENGLVALEIWKNERPRIVITDWMMPVMDGLELCREFVNLRELSIPTSLLSHRVLIPKIL